MLRMASPAVAALRMGGHLEQQVQQGHGLVDVAAEAAVVFVALQGLKELDDLDHLLVGHGGRRKAVWVSWVKSVWGVDSADRAFRLMWST